MAPALGCNLLLGFRGLCLDLNLFWRDSRLFFKETQLHVAEPLAGRAILFDELQTQEHPQMLNPTFATGDDF